MGKMNKSLLLLVFLLVLPVVFSVVVDVNTKSECPDGFVVQNLSRSSLKVECVAVNSLVNLSALNNSIINLSSDLGNYSRLDGSNQPFYDSSLFNSINTNLRILYNNAGNSLCTWHNALGTGFDCVTLSQNGNTVLDTSNFVSYVNATYGNNYCENTTSIVIGAYDDC
jgi:hypothetical protein